MTCELCDLDPIPGEFEYWHVTTCRDDQAPMLVLRRHSLSATLEESADFVAIWEGMFPDVEWFETRITDGHIHFHSHKTRNPLQEVRGKWPGDESIEEILEALKGLDGGSRNG